MLPLEAPDPRRTAWLTALLLALSAACIGHAINVRDGEFSYRDGPRLIDALLIAINWVGLGLGLCVAGVICSRVRDPGRGERAIVVALGVGVAFGFLQLLRSPPSGWNPWSNDLRPIDQDFRLYYAGVAAAAVLSIGLFFPAVLVRRVCLALLLLTHLALGVWTIRATPSPRIDVFVFQQQGPAALLQGKNPYDPSQVRYDDIYAKGEAPSERKVYGDGMTKDGKVAFGFPYPPVSLLMSTAAYWAAGDYRYGHVVSMTLTGALLAFARPGRTAAIAAVLLLFTPRAFFILGRGWSEPHVAVLLALVVFCAFRFPKLLPIALGLFMASKQYLIIAAPAVLVLAVAIEDRRRAVALVWQSVVVALVVTLPLALWNWGEFWRSTMTVQKDAPFRDDALSFLVAWKQLAGPTMLGHPLARGAEFTALGGAAIGIGLALWRAPRNVSGFAAALAVILLPLIAFNKQAFANYYYFILAALCAAVAAWKGPPSGEENDVTPTYV